MKILKIMSVMLMALFVYGISHGMETKPNWEDMRLSAGVDVSGNLELKASIDSDTNLSDWYSLGIDIGNESYRKFFQYNANTGMLEVVFETGISASSGSVPYFLSIKDVQYNELYTWDGGLSLEGGSVTATTVNQAATQADTSLTNNSNGAAESPASTNTNTNFIIGGQYNRTSAIPTNASKSGNPTVVSPDPIIVSTEPVIMVPEVVTPVVVPEAEPATVEAETSVTTPVAPTSQQNQGHTPKYDSRSDEPNRINGIGNSKSYKSWRAQK